MKSLFTQVTVLFTSITTTISAGEYPGEVVTIPAFDRILTTTVPASEIAFDETTSDVALGAAATGVRLDGTDADDTETIDAKLRSAKHHSLFRGTWRNVLLMTNAISSRFKARTLCNRREVTADYIGVVLLKPLSSQDASEGTRKRIRTPEDT